MIYDKLHLGGCLLDFMIEVKKAQNVLEAYHGNQQTFTVIHMPFNTTEEMDLDQFDDKLNEFYLVKNLGQVLSREIGVPFFSVDIYAKTHSIGLYQNKESWAVMSNVLYMGTNKTKEFHDRVYYELDQLREIITEVKNDSLTY